MYCIQSIEDEFDTMTMFDRVFVGQSVAAFAQPYLMFAPTKLAALWFQEEMRAVANTIGSMGKLLVIRIYTYGWYRYKAFCWFFLSWRLHR